jgi:hypothetical protein
LTDAQRDAEAVAKWEAWLTTRLREEREFLLTVVREVLGKSSPRHTRTRARS